MSDKKLYQLTSLTPGASDLVYIARADGSADGSVSFTDAASVLGGVLTATFQPLSANLTIYAGIAPSANVQSYLGAANYSAMRTLLGLVIGTNVQAYSANLTTFAAIAPSANVQTLLGAADYSAFRTSLGLGTAALLASDTDTTLAANSDSRVATQKAVKAYVAANGSGVSDGDKGDVVVSATGATWTIDTNVVSDAKLRQSAGLSIIGRSANSTGNVADITAASDGQVLRRSGTAIGFGAVDLTSANAVTGILPVANGGTGAAVPSRVLITETVTSSSQTTVTFSTIAATYRDLEIVVRGRGTTAATLVTVQLRFNNDSSAIYDDQTVQGVNVSATVYQNRAATSANIMNVPGSTATANEGGMCVIRVADYRGTTFEKSGTVSAAFRRGTTSADIFTENKSIFWRSTAAVTRVDVFVTAGGFVDGSVVSLYGLM